MTAPRHPLDRPVWAALTTRQSDLALGDARAMRFQPDFGLFAAAANADPQNLAALAALIPADGGLALVETEEQPLPPGTRILFEDACHQMIAHAISPPRTVDHVPLGDADAGEMVALAELTQPGPFFSRTHRLGDFIGIKLDGRLAAMAGERMRPTGFTEVSAVCTHPDHRGRGYAGALMAKVAAKILAREETPFLHVYARNTGAIALYEKLGFSLRRTVTMRVLVRG